jgi:hypothetical protein
MRQDPAYEAYQAMNQTGGLKITPPGPGRPARRPARGELHASSAAEPFQPGKQRGHRGSHQPGTGKVGPSLQPAVRHRAQPDQRDYAVDTRFNGGQGVQTGSSSKLFTLLTALKQGVPFGFNEGLSSPSRSSATPTARGRCHAVPGEQRQGPASPGAFLSTTAPRSRNVFYANLEQKVGLYSVVQTAQVGVHRANGTSLTEGVGRWAARTTGTRRMTSVVHARLGERVADDDGRGLRHGRRRGSHCSRSRSSGSSTGPAPICRSSQRTATRCCRRRSPTAIHVLQGGTDCPLAPR